MGWRLTIPLVVATLLCMAALTWLGAPLQTEAAPGGILTFELAGSPEAARRIVASWDAATRETAAFTLGLDYLFLALYPSAIAVVLLQASAGLGRWSLRLRALARATAWLSLAAAPLDATENAALWLTLRGGGAPWPQVAAVCAVPKFAIVGAGLCCALLGGAAALMGANRGAR